VARALKLVMKRPPLTASAIAGVINDANLDPGEATRDLGYQPLGVTEGFQRCFPIPQQAPSSGHAAFQSQIEKGSTT
jgi:NADH dehydrogenase